MRKSLFISLLAWVITCSTAYAQEKKVEDKVPSTYKPLKINLNEDGTEYIRFITWLQMWTTATSLNPGTVGLDGKAQSSSMDVGIRRSRLLILAQLNSKWLILTHFGINNQSFINGGVSGTDGKKPQLYVHDAWTEYTVVPKKLNIGVGLHYWNGVSRMASASTLNFMTLDAPVFNWFTIETNDQFARQLGIYAKGQLGKLDYRLALNKPFANGANPYLATTANTGIAKNAISDDFAQAGYFKYMFKDAESDLLPFEVGSYLGAKKVFNVGVGFYHHPNSVYTKNDAVQDSVVTSATTVLGADVYYDAPVGSKGSSVNVYGLFQSMDYGDKYLRNIGILNTSTTLGTATQLGNDSANASVFGAGNVQPTLGTGSLMYVQLGYKFPKKKRCGFYALSDLYLQKF
ncbi:MAG: porin [Sphingobacteriales bacterium]|nr:porin [Sphingobacteriales bacterium]